MPHYIIKLNDGKRDWYLEWSTIRDAPITDGMSLRGLREYIKEEYGRAGLRDLPRRLALVEKKGTSCPYESTSEMIRYNRAGVDETTLTRAQIIEMYCRRKRKIRGRG